MNPQFSDRASEVSQLSTSVPFVKHEVDLGRLPGI